MKNVVLTLIFSFSFFINYAQDSVDIDGRLRPVLNEFFEECKKHGIKYHEKLFQLKRIDITNELPLEEGNTVMGKVNRNEYGQIESILINWVALVDPEILKVVAFHEFSHHFLDSQHTCIDCDDIMAINNSSYFGVVKEWDKHVEHLFKTSPVYLKRNNSLAYSTN